MSPPPATTALRGARVLVTGAAGGIGQHTCAVLRQVGAQVVGADLSAADKASVTDAWVSLDVTDDDAVSEAVAGLGPLDVVILSHGVTSLGPVVETPMAAVDRVIDVNLRGAILVTRAALPGLILNRGRIAVLSSVAGFAPLVNRAAYSASKHGIHGYFESLRSELVDDGVSVTIVAPSFVATGIDQRAAFRAGGESGDWSTTGEVLDPAEVARVIVDGIARRRPLVLPSRTARTAYLLSRVAPELYARTMRRRVLGSR